MPGFSAEESEAEPGWLPLPATLTWREREDLIGAVTGRGVRGLVMPPEFRLDGATLALLLALAHRSRARLQLRVPPALASRLCELGLQSRFTLV